MGQGGFGGRNRTPVVVDLVTGPLLEQGVRIDDETKELIGLDGALTERIEGVDERL